MTSKERVLAAIGHREPDRVPCDFHATADILARLYQHFGIDGYRELMACLGFDIVDIRGIIDPLWQGPFPKEVDLGGGVRQNYLGWRLTTVTTEFGQEVAHCGFALEGAAGLDELEAFLWPRVDWFDFSNMNALLDHYRDYAIMASGASVFQHPTLIRRMDNLLFDMMEAPERARFVIDRYTDFYVDYYDAMFAATNGRIDLLRIADDLGTQEGPLISPGMFAQYVKPSIKKLVDVAHSHGVKVLFHSCGSIVEFIGDLIDVGVDVLDPLQPRAKGMALAAIRERFGGRICFHGAIDTQYTLPRGTPEDVEAEVRDRIAVMDGAPGLIIAPAHDLQPDVPVPNILRMYEAVATYGRR